MTNALRVPPNPIQQIVQSKRFLAADRAKLDLGEIATWDRTCCARSACWCRSTCRRCTSHPEAREAMVRLPMLVAGENGKVAQSTEDGLPDPFAAGTPRPAGVHLHWAMPDALLRGTMADVPSGRSNRLALPVLPDRWVVLRILLPDGASRSGNHRLGARSRSRRRRSARAAGRKAAMRRATPCRWAPRYPRISSPARSAARSTWCGRVRRGAQSLRLSRSARPTSRRSRRKASTGLRRVSRRRLVERCRARPARRGAQATTSLHELLERLRWRLLYEWGDAQWALSRRAAGELRHALGLTRPIAGQPAARGAEGGGARRGERRVAVRADRQDVRRAADTIAASSAFATDVDQRFVAPAWQLRSSLLHGAIYGVPVRERHRRSTAARRAAQLAVALGHHDDDLLAALASPDDATRDQRRATERLLAAFTAQKVDRHRLARRPGRARGARARGASRLAARRDRPATDRFLQRVQTGGVRRARPRPQARATWRRGDANRGARHESAVAARPKAPSPRGATGGASARRRQRRTTFSRKSKPTLIATSAADQRPRTLARRRRARAHRGTRGQAPRAALHVPERADGGDPRRWPQPAPRPRRPRLGRRQAHLPLADARDHRDQRPDRARPLHPLARQRRVPARGVDARARGAAARPVSRRVDRRTRSRQRAPRRTPILLSRLKAESVLRFGADGTYDGATVAFSPAAPKATTRRAAAARRAQPIEPGVREQQTLVADELRRFSLYKGADPDLVGVTTWAQPWVPMWLEWEVKVEGLDPADARRVAPRRRGPRGTAAGSIDGDTVMLRGRALLTTGAATTLHDAIDDWLTAEDALDAARRRAVDRRSHRDGVPRRSTTRCTISTSSPRRSTACARSCSACRSAMACAVRTSGGDDRQPDAGARRPRSARRLQ